MSEGEIIRNLKLGESADVLANKKGSPTEQLLAVIANDVVDSLRKKLDEYDVNASSNLKQSLTVIPLSKSNEVNVEISADFYWKYINYGVNGSIVNHGAPSWGKESQSNGKSFIQNIKDWVAFRGITLPSQFSSYDSFAWAIKTSVERNGKKPRPFYSDVVNEKLKNEIQEAITALFGKSITVNIIEPWQ